MEPVKSENYQCCGMVWKVDPKHPGAEAMKICPKCGKAGQQVGGGDFEEDELNFFPVT